MAEERRAGDPWIAIRELPDPATGILVTRLDEDSMLRYMGLRPGDALHSINALPTPTRAALLGYPNGAGRRAGCYVFEIERAGRRITRAVHLRAP